MTLANPWIMYHKTLNSLHDFNILVRLNACYYIVNLNHYHPSLIFADKARSLLLEWSPTRGSALLGSGLAQEVTG
jgi:hypothetical protein